MDYWMVVAPHSPPLADFCFCFLSIFQRWFEESEIPLDKMWADDKHWYPLFLAGKHFEGTFHFKDTHTLVRHELTEVADAAK